MDRRGFLKWLGFGAGAYVVAPVLDLSQQFMFEDGVTRSAPFIVPSLHIIAKEFVRLLSERRQFGSIQPMHRLDGGANRHQYRVSMCADSSQWDGITLDQAAQRYIKPAAWAIAEKIRQSGESQNICGAFDPSSLAFAEVAIATDPKTNVSARVMQYCHDEYGNLLCADILTGVAT